MTNILDIIVQYAAIWAPSLTAILGIVTTILIAVNKTKEQIDKLRADNDLTKKELLNLATQLKSAIDKDEVLCLELKAAADAYTGIKNYVDQKVSEIRGE